MRKKFRYLIGIFSFMVFAVLTFYLIKKSKQSVIPISKSHNTIAFFINKSIDLDTIRVNIETEIKIPFENRGNNKLIIYNIIPNCGCTIPKWPDKPLPPGEKDTLIILFNPYETGYFNKTLSIFANNTGGPIIIRISGFCKKILDELSWCTNYKCLFCEEVQNCNTDPQPNCL